MKWISLHFIPTYYVFWLLIGFKKNIQKTPGRRWGIKRSHKSIVSKSRCPRGAQIQACVTWTINKKCHRHCYHTSKVTSYLLTTNVKSFKPSCSYNYSSCVSVLAYFCNFVSFSFRTVFVIQSKSIVNLLDMRTEYSQIWSLGILNDLGVSLLWISVSISVPAIAIHYVMLGNCRTGVFCLLSRLCSPKLSIVSAQ